MFLLSLCDPLNPSVSGCHHTTRMKEEWRAYFPYPVIRDLVVVIVIIAGIANPVLVIVFLPRVGKVGAVVLKRRRHS